MAFNISTNPKTATSWDTITSPQAYAYKPSASVAINNENINEKNNKAKKKAPVILGTVLSMSLIASSLMPAFLFTDYEGRVYI